MNQRLRYLCTTAAGKGRSVVKKAAQGVIPFGKDGGALQAIAALDFHQGGERPNSGALTKSVFVGLIESVQGISHTFPMIEGAVLLQTTDDLEVRSWTLRQKMREVKQASTGDGGPKSLAPERPLASPGPSLDQDRGASGGLDVPGPQLAP